MHTLPSPRQTYDEVFNACISGMDVATKQTFGKAFPKLKLETELYDQKMKSLEGHEIKAYAAFDYSPLKKNNLKWLYQSRFLGQKVPGRKYYDKFLVRAKKRGCCFCSYDDPTELDHFLPISKFPQFAIHPNNLVPVCHRCNKNKWTYVPVSADENLIHPFFESYEDEEWLHVEVIFMGNTPIAKYYIQCDEMDRSVIDRMTNHFEEIELFERYSSQASRELSGVNKRLRDAFDERGREALKNDLIEEADSRGQSHLNSWQSALYRGWAANDDFLDMNWKL